MRSRALSFGAVAAAYERFRLGYPPEVADVTLAYAAGPVRRALEVGAGTGKATTLFAGRGIAVTACEPDPQMAAELTTAVAGLPVSVAVATFEAFVHDEPYDLLFAASAWHWTAAETRWSHTAELVRPGGTVAFFGSGQAGSQLADPALRETVAVVRRPFIDDEERLTEGRADSGTWWPGSELERESAFADVEEHDLPRLVERTRDEHLGVLGTVSAYLLLEPEPRATLLAAIGAVLPDTFLVEADVRLHLARRV